MYDIRAALEAEVADVEPCDCHDRILDRAHQRTKAGLWTVALIGTVLLALAVALLLASSLRETPPAQPATTLLEAAR